MARKIANGLQGELDVVLVHKIGAPDQPEFAIGSVSEFGSIFESAAATFSGVLKESFQQAAQEEIAKLEKKRALYSPIRPPIDPADRVVIIIDDGLATGATMLAALRAIRPRKPRKLIAAAPVASTDALALIQNEADECVILDVPESFFAISQFYENFAQVSDEEVIQALASAKQPRQAA